MQLVERGIPLPFGMVENSRSLIGLRNLVDAVHACLRHPAAAGKTFLPSDGCPVSTPELICTIAKAFGKKARLLPVPVVLMRSVARLAGKTALADRLLGSLTVDSTSMQRQLNWDPPFNFEQEIDETVAWYLRDKLRHEAQS
jgi:nucleoside-diphosphate-sugar epimerase